MTRPRIVMIMMVLALAVSACGKRDEVQLRNIKRTGNGPDEFSILPGKPLQAPENFTTLPTPTPGGPSLTDQNPNADGIAALGGNAGALTVTAAAARDGALINYANRYGVTPGIRQTLASEDKEIRRRHGRVNIFNIGPVDDYVMAYRRQWLDGYAEMRRLRRLGIETPTAPPEEN